MTNSNKQQLAQGIIIEQKQKAWSHQSSLAATVPSCRSLIRSLIAVRNDRFCNAECIDQLLPCVKIQAKNGLTLLYAPRVGFAWLIRVGSICSMVSHLT